MRRRNREINIFSMSALDLFASALGAFILISIVIFPYFGNISPVDPESLRQRLREVRRQLAQTQSEFAQTQSELTQSQSQLAQAMEREAELQSALERERLKFVLVTISWSRSDDVDLHVVDPSGREYAYDARSHTGSTARFEEDATRGPGNEVWLHPRAEPGEYVVYYNLFSARGDGVEVRGAVIPATGREDLATTRLEEEGERVRIAAIVVGRDGDITIGNQ